MTSTSGSRVEPVERVDHLGHRVRALHGDVLDPELDGRPAAPGVLQDVALGGRAAPGDQPDHAGQERQRALALGGEEALGGQHGLTRSSRASSSPSPTVRISPAASESDAAADVELGLGVHHDPGALDEWRLHGVEHAARGR